MLDQTLAPWLEHDSEFPELFCLAIEIGMDFQGGLRLGLGLRIVFTFCALSAQSPNDQRVLKTDIY